jgi:hypothetical protein
MVLIIFVMFAVPASVAFADDGSKDEGKLGRLFLFQKCDPILAQDAEEEGALYDENGCPLPGNGPWPAFLDNRRWAQMKYNLLGEQLRFSLQGKRLLPETDYTLIYYPDPWPGNGLICLGSNTTNANGNVQIHGKADIPFGLPAPYDENFNPIEPSGASGAKIWLVLSNDVKCDASLDEDSGEVLDPTAMIGWNPADYLFEGNLIVYQYFPESPDDMDVDDEEDEEDEDPDEVESDKNSFGSAKGKGRNKGRSGSKEK